MMSYRGIALGLCLSCLGVPLRAWGPVGHKAVAMISQARLNRETSAAVESILGPGITLDRIADCADNLIYGQTDCGGVFTINVATGFATMRWHFIDLPVPGDIDADAIMDHCPGGVNCVVARISLEARMLRDSGASLQDRRTALMFLVHFVGDIHQPLHAATGKPDDHGGNLKLMHNILLDGQPISLHKLWDGVITHPAQTDFHLPDAVLTSRAREMAHALGSGINDRDADSWADGDWAVRAALESHSIAQKVIYPAYAASQGNDLLADYQERMQAIADRRVQMAGVRLAALLERVLDRDHDKGRTHPQLNAETVRDSIEATKAALTQ